MLRSMKFVVLLSVFYVSVIAAPYQELPPKPGYVPVYIREGSTPLSQINPKLVEAFHEDEEQQEISKAIDVAKDNNKNQATEYVKKEVETNEKVKQVNDTKDNDKEQLQFNEEAKQQEHEPPASDIAKFTSDDIKLFAYDSPDIETR